MHLTRVLAAILISFLSSTALVRSASRDAFHYPITPGVRELFLDDLILGDLFNVEHRVHAVHKHPDAMVSADRPWEKIPVGDSSFKELVEYYGAPVWNPGEEVWKMWPVIGDGRPAGFARSRDGIRWEKPDLGVVDYEGSRNNNLIAVEGDPKALIVHVLMHPGAPPDRRYAGLCWLGARGREAVASSDGYRFRKLGHPPIPGQDTSHLNYDEKGNRYILTVKHPGSFGRSVYLSLSPDLALWSSHELIFHADLLDQELEPATD